jgi:hypothetical protein
MTDEHEQAEGRRRLADRLGVHVEHLPYEDARAERARRRLEARQARAARLGVDWRYVDDEEFDDGQE